MTSDPIILYLIARKELPMSSGKLAAQVGHAVEDIVHAYYKACQQLDVLIRNNVIGSEDPIQQELTQKVSIFNLWTQSKRRKVVLGAKDKDWSKLKEFSNCFVIQDLGLTEVDPGSETVIGLYPMYKSTSPTIIKKLQLL